MKKISKNVRHALMAILWFVSVIIMFVGFGFGGFGMVLLLILFVPIWISPLVYGKKMNITTGKIIASLVVLLFIVISIVFTYKQSNTPEATFKITSEIPEIINGNSYEISLKVNNATQISIGDKVFNISTGEEYLKYIIDLDTPEKRVNIGVSNKYWDTGTVLVLHREKTQEEIEAKKQEQLDIKAEKIKKEEEQEIRDMTAHPLKYLEIIKNERSVEGFGNVGEHTITVKNTSNLDYKDIKFKATYYSKSETKLGTNTAIVYEIIKAGQTKTFRNINFGFIDGQSSSSIVKIIDVSLIN